MTRPAPNLHPLLTRTLPDYDGDKHARRLLDLTEAIDVETAALEQLRNYHLVSALQLDRTSLVQLSRLAALYESEPTIFHRPLSGKILISAFYEPSTRTRLSFESAWHRLGGDIMSITDPNSTGIAKGESLEDVGEMFNNYGSVVVLRDSTEDAVYRMLESLRIPIINAGNGIDEHPTQALADLYTLFKWRPELALPESRCEPIRVGVIGNPARMRTVRSLLWLLSLISDKIAELVIINSDKDLFEPEQLEYLKACGLNIRVDSQLSKVLPDLDVIYINSIAWIGDSYERLTGDLKLSARSPLKKGAIVLHPLARGDELDADLDSTEHNWYFTQARGAVYIRMALLTSVVRSFTEQKKAEPGMVLSPED